MRNCPYCDQKLQRIAQGLYQCPTSELYFKSPYTQGLLASSLNMEVVSESSQPVISSSPQSLNPDMTIFVNQVVERLTPLDGLDRDARYRALKIRVQERQELTDVLNGKTKMTDWFTKARREANIKEYELVQILYECLEGLRSEEARELKKQLEGVYKQFVRMRTIGPTG